MCLTFGLEHLARVSCFRCFVVLCQRMSAGRPMSPAVHIRTRPLCFPFYWPLRSRGRCCYIVVASVSVLNPELSPCRGTLSLGFSSPAYFRFACCMLARHSHVRDIVPRSSGLVPALDQCVGSARRLVLCIVRMHSPYPRHGFFSSFLDASVLLGPSASATFLPASSVPHV